MKAVVGVPPRCGQVLVVELLKVAAAPPGEWNRSGTVLARLLTVAVPMDLWSYCCGKELVLVAGEWLAHKKACSAGCSVSYNQHRFL